MKFITTIALIFLTLPIWAEDRGIRIHQSNLESFCPVRRAWIPIDRHVSDFRSAKNGVAYRAHGKLYFFNYKTGTNHYIEKRVSTYDIADNNAISFVHDRDLYVTTAPGSKRPVRLKGNITSFQFSDNGVLGFVDDGDLYLATNCQSGAVRKLKGNIRSYKIHDNGTFAFVDDGELYIVSDTSNGHIRKLSSRVYDYNFTQNGELFYKDRHGMFKVTNCHTGHVERLSEHRNHNHGYENRGSRHRGHEQSNRFRYNQWKSHNGKQYTFRNNELYVLENNRPKCIARNVRDYKFSGKNITYTTDRSAHLILPEDNWRDINLGDRHSSCRILGNGDIEVHHGKSKYQLCKKLNYKRLPVNDYHSFRDGIIYSHNKQIIFENAHRRNVIANGVDRFHRGKDKIYFCMNKSVFSFDGRNKRCLFENAQQIHILSGNRVVIHHGKEWHLISDHGTKCLTRSGLVSIIGKEMVLLEDRTLYTLNGNDLERLDWGVDRFMPAGEFLFYFKGRSLYQISDIRNCRTNWIGSVY